MQIIINASQVINISEKNAYYYYTQKNPRQKTH